MEETIMIKLLGEPCLRAGATETVTVFDDKLKELTNTMINAMYSARGRGLSANQIGRNERLFVMDGKYSFDKDGNPINQSPVVCINPVVLPLGDIIKFNEGCLSIPGVECITERYDRMSIVYYDLEGNKQEATAEGLEAIIIQHELEHLNGKLYIDQLKPLKKQMAIKRFNKMKKRFYAIRNLKVNR